MVISNDAELAATMKARTHRRWNVVEYEAESYRSSNDTELTRVSRVLMIVDPNESAVSTLFHAIKRVHQLHRVRFYVAGLGRYQAEFEQWCGGIGLGKSIEFLQDSDRCSPHGAFQRCDLCVVVGSATCSDKDSDFRKDIMEAYRNRKPVVATEFANIREVVIEEVTGLLVPQDDFVALADAVNNLLAHPFKRERFGESGYELRQETSAWDLIMSELEDLHCIASGLPFRLQPIAYRQKKHTYAN
jgi:glycosyltransferase involved in cell wall biosynthesis